MIISTPRLTIKISSHVAKEILDSSVFFLRLRAYPMDPNSFLMSFYSPKIRPVTGEKVPSYRIEIGEKGTNQIRRDLNKMVIPQIRGDILEEDHAILEKVLLRLRRIILKEAMEYQGLSEEERKTWKSLTRLDITKFSDVGVKIQEEGEASQMVASIIASLDEFNVDQKKPTEH